jgi:solute carrier family 25, member 33/36
MFSAGTASIIVYTTMNPVWLIKTRLQLQEVGHQQKGNPNYQGYMDCISRVYKEEGFKGFYKGLTASYMGVFESATYFMIYEKLKIMVNERKENPSDQYTAVFVFIL